MNYYFAWIAVLALQASWVHASQGTGSNWDPVMEDETLLVERRAYEKSGLNEIRGVTRIRASLNALMALLKDANFNHHWVYRSGGARVLQAESYAQIYVYGIVNAPLPMSDRDTVVRFDYRQHPQTKVITISISNFPEFIGAKSGLVRVPDFGGHWCLRPQAGGWVEVTYQIYGDPGGWIPVWIANYAAEISVTRTLQNMSAVVGRYEGASSRFVEELPK
jgi:hypothetical protein